jgi:flavin reductase (DIM6/NTAB) family NADH-FMN oxidoreductase RutF
LTIDGQARAAAMTSRRLSEPEAISKPTAWELDSGSDAMTFRSAMRRVVGGVTVITTWHERRPWGMTVSAFTPVCMDPPTILVCLHSRTVTASNVSKVGRFSVSLLSESQLGISKLCSQPGEDKYLEAHVVPPEELPARTSMPVLRDSVATFECKASEIRPVGTHLVVIAPIVAILAPAPLNPLLYGLGKYMAGVELGVEFRTQEASHVSR